MSNPPPQSTSQGTGQKRKADTNQIIDPDTRNPISSSKKSRAALDTDKKKMCLQTLCLAYKNLHATNLTKEDSQYTTI